ncbi:putative transcription initiation factor 31kd [Phaeomoniella chlamydospora]|uniref:Putative transcription initiation factor 31kd n=1 Tax=Phaeomoniella chlamydospora TaxID=158046 RepID=A0A0G2E982_PHACM|nr:putative transcription initiation factor 31kd [Phaeomoniella chlamydospora]
MGVSAYQERVPLQLLDFAYRYTSSVLQDALHLQAEGYDTADTGTGGKGRGRGAGAAAAKDNDPNAADPGGISLTSLRMAIASRSQHQFQQTLPKEFLLELASKRNAVGLPGSIRGGTRISDKNEGVSIGGVRLPHERYCLSGTGWSLKDSWDSEGEEEVEDGKVVNGFGGGDVGMEGTDDNPAGPTGDGEDMDMEEAAEREGLEDLFGGNNTKKEDEDHEMGDG